MILQNRLRCYSNGSKFNLKVSIGMQQKVIDAHTHIFPDKLANRASENVGQYYGIGMECDGTVSQLVGGASGLDARFIICAAALKPENAVAGNDYLLSQAKADNRFIPLCSVHPLQQNYAAELERVKNAGAKGLKLHPDFQHFNIDDISMIEVYKIAAELELPILFHVGDANTDASSPSRLYKALDKVPSLRAVAAHMGGYLAWDEAEKLLYGTPVYFDTSDALLSLSPERVEQQIRKHGIEKIMFGSDYPLRSTKSAFEAFDALNLTEEEKMQIYYTNAQRFYKI